MSRVLIFLSWATYTAERFTFLESCPCAIPLFLLLLKNCQFLSFICRVLGLFGRHRTETYSFTSGKRRFMGINENQQEIRTQGSFTFCLSLRGCICFLTSLFISVRFSLLTGYLKTVSSGTLPIMTETLVSDSQF